MEEFEITITETLKRKVKVKAECYDEAISKAIALYNAEKNCIRF